MPAGDNPHSISEKKAALRESPKQLNNIVNEQPTTSRFPKNKVAATVGIKRPQPYGPLSLTNHHTLSNPGANGHLVYVRRRFENDQSKGGTSSRGESASSTSTSLKKAGAGSLQSQERTLKHQNNTSHAQCASQSASPAAAAATPSPALQSAVLPAHHSFGKQSPGKVAAQPANDVTTSLPPSNVVSSTAVLQSSVAANLAPSGTNAASSDAISATTLAPNQAPPSRSSNQDRSERFLRLQAFLRHNEQSDQEEYLHKLRSLSPVGRSRHAFELEKRAADLLIEEGKELQKMKVLNVLGKLVTPSLPNQPPSIMHLPFTARR
ncbi:hypothetical protein SORBI_3002G287300 [Sorghum bicolor]|uniref:Uncharacterized protein n=1 Tax=Sorghum bicolor TaxID=4558 RepID=A0A1W0W699_SORBI|nr:hypothetical protein SORBI_3002G287300 [Sorghum bicolor]OQU89877.1 hypothetical protein SORBI_3002G287300 [Sorghum bicolor]